MMVSRAECADCDAHVDYLSRDKDLCCECGGEMEFVGKVGVVYGSGNDIRPEVQKHIEDWRERARGIREDEPDDYWQGVRNAYAELAQELEDLLSNVGARSEGSE